MCSIASSMLEGMIYPAFPAFPCVARRSCPVSKTRASPIVTVKKSSVNDLSDKSIGQLGVANGYRPSGVVIDSATMISFLRLLTRYGCTQNDLPSAPASNLSICSTIAEFWQSTIVTSALLGSSGVPSLVVLAFRKRVLVIFSICPMQTSPSGLSSPRGSVFSC